MLNVHLWQTDNMNNIPRRRQDEKGLIYEAETIHREVTGLVRQELKSTMWMMDFIRRLSGPEDLVEDVDLSLWVNGKASKVLLQHRLFSDMIYILFHEGSLKCSVKICTIQMLKKEWNTTTREDLTDVCKVAVVVTALEVVSARKKL